MVPINAQAARMHRAIGGRGRGVIDLEEHIAVAVPGERDVGRPCEAADFDWPGNRDGGRAGARLIPRCGGGPLQVQALGADKPRRGLLAGGLYGDAERADRLDRAQWQYEILVWC